MVGMGPALSKKDLKVWQTSLIFTSRKVTASQDRGGGKPLRT